MFQIYFLNTEIEKRQQVVAAIILLASRTKHRTRAPRPVPLLALCTKADVKNLSAGRKKRYPAHKRNPPHSTTRTQHRGRESTELHHRRRAMHDNRPQEPPWVLRFGQAHTNAARRASRHARSRFLVLDGKPLALPSKYFGIIYWFINDIYYFVQYLVTLDL